VTSRTARLIAAGSLAATLALGAAPAIACPRPPARICWLKSATGWKPVPPAIRKQLVADGEQVRPRARIKYGDTTVIDLDGRCGGRKVTS
jgi:hypothetical protein